MDEPTCEARPGATRGPTVRDADAQHRAVAPGDARHLPPRAVLDGESIITSETEIGYLHRCFEKMSETHTWNQVIPYTDRLNYCSAMINNVGYCRRWRSCSASRRRRRRSGRGRSSPSSRASWTICVCQRLDAGRHRRADELLVPVPAARGDLRGAGGVLRAPPHDLVRAASAASRGPAARLRGRLPDGCSKCIPTLIDDMETLITRTGSSWTAPTGSAPSPPKTRSTGAGPDPACAPRAWPTTCARRTRTSATRRSTSRSRSLTPATPTSATWSACRRCGSRSGSSTRRSSGCQPGPVIVDDHHVALPPKDEVYTEMESLIWHFKLIMEGIKVPAGEKYG